MSKGGVAGSLWALCFGLFWSLAPLPLGAEESFTMRIAAVQETDMNYLRNLPAMVREIEQSSGGKVRVELLLHGQAGGEREALQAQMEGKIEAGWSSALTMARFLREFRLLTIPYLFNNEEEVRAWANSPLDEALRQTTEKSPLQVLGYGSYGFYGVLSFRRSNPEGGPWAALTGMMVRSPRDDWAVAVSRALLLRPLQVPADELATAVERGWIQGVVATPEMVARTSLPGKSTEYFATRHLHGWSLFTVNRHWLASLPAALRKGVVEAVQRGLAKSLINRDQEVLAEWNRKKIPALVTGLGEEGAERLRPWLLTEMSQIEAGLGRPGVVRRLWEERRMPLGLPSAAAGSGGEKSR